MFSASKIESGNKTTKTTHRRNRKSDFPAIRARCTWRARTREDDGKDDYEREGMKERTDMQIHPFFSKSARPLPLASSTRFIVLFFVLFLFFAVSFGGFTSGKERTREKGDALKEVQRRSRGQRCSYNDKHLWRPTRNILLWEQRKNMWKWKIWVS